MRVSTSIRTAFKAYNNDSYSPCSINRAVLDRTLDFVELYLNTRENIALLKPV